MGGCKSKEVSIHGGHVFGGDVSMKQGKSAGKGTGGTVTRKKSKKEKAADNRKTDALIKSYKSKIDDLDGEPSDDDKRADLETLCGANAALRPLCQWEGVALPPGWFSAAAIRKDGVPTGVDYVYALNGHVQSRKPQWYPNRHEDAKVPGLLPGWGKTPSRSRPGQYVYAHNKIAGLRVGAVPDLACALAPLRTADGGPLAPGWKQCERGDVPGRYYYENQPVEIAAAADNTHTFLADRTRLHVRAQLRPWEAHSCERIQCSAAIFSHGAGRITFARINPQRMALVHRACGVDNAAVCTPEEEALIEAEREARKSRKKPRPQAKVRPKDDGPAVLGNARPPKK